MRLMLRSFQALALVVLASGANVAQEQKQPEVQAGERTPVWTDK